MHSSDNYEQSVAQSTYMLPTSKDLYLK